MAAQKLLNILEQQPLLAAAGCLGLWELINHTIAVL